VVRKSWIPKLKLLMAEGDAYSAFLADSVKMEADALVVGGAEHGAFDPASLEAAAANGEAGGGGGATAGGAAAADVLPAASSATAGDGSTLF